MKGATELRAVLTSEPEIGSLFKSIRINQGVTITHLAERLGRSERQLYRYEANEVEMPAGILLEWATVLGYTVALLAD